MNRIYRIVFNPHLNIMQVAPETARGRGKCKATVFRRTSVLAGTVLTLASLIVSPAIAQGGKGGGSGGGAGGGVDSNYQGMPGQNGTSSAWAGGGGGPGAVGGNGNGAGAGSGGLGGPTPGTPGSDGGSTGPTFVGAGGGGGGAHGYTGTALGAASFTGGDGGAGGNADNGDGGGGGAGGYGAVVIGGGTGSVPEGITLTGGQGGAGGDSNRYGPGRGGAGGAGMAFVGSSLAISGKLAGGQGGDGGADRAGSSAIIPGGEGGAGLIIRADNVTLSGEIVGGNGGAGGHELGVGGAVSAGGIGIRVDDDSIAISNAGMISGGLSADGNTRADAIRFAGGTNRLELIAGGTIIGNVDASSGSDDTLVLGGDDNGHFDTSTIGNTGQYRGFEAFEKTGKSIWTLTGVSSYTGDTTVNGGTLLVNGTSISSAHIVNSDATLGGTGSVGGTTVNAGGTLAPGNGGVGTLTVDGNLMLASGSLLDYQLGMPGTAGSPASGRSDRIDISGDLALNGTLSLAQSDDASDGLAGLGYYRLMTYGGELSGSGLALGDTPDLNAGYRFETGNQRVDLFIGAAGDDMLQHWQGGDGTWNDTGTQWLNKDGEMPDVWAGNHAIFKHQPGDFEGGVVAVEGSQGFKGLQFVDEGYRVEGSGVLETHADGSEIRVLAEHAEIATEIAGTGGIIKTETGTLVLSGDSSNFAGSTTVRAGTLQVGDADGKASLGGSLNVFNGATLAGSGAVGSGSGSGSLITIASGGTLAPGNSIGTLTVDGDLMFESGSRFEVEVNPQGTDSDRVDVTGDATLNGGTVAHIGAHGDYDPRSSYTILTAGGALTGAFDTVTSDFAFLTPDLLYDYGAGTVDLELSRNEREFASTALTRNQVATAGGIESIGLAAGHAVYDAIVQLPDDERLIRRSFDALSGEIHASLKTAFIEDSRFIRHTATDRVRAAFSAPGASSAPVSAYGSDDGTPLTVAADHHGPVVWTQAFGSWGKTDSNGNAASLDRNTGGMLIGADRSVGDWRIGVLAGYSHTDVKARDRDSSGKSDNFHLGLYGGTQWDALGLRTGVAYTWHDMDTRRSVAIPGFSGNPKASYDAGTLQAFAELGYGMDVGAFRIEPFVNVAHVRLHTDGYSESGGATGLSGSSKNMDITFTTLGVHAEHALDIGTTAATLRGTLGWRHAFGDTTPKARHGFSAGDAFTVTGAPIAKDSAVIEAGIDLNLTPNATFGLSYAGQLAGSARDHGVKADLRIRF